MIIVGGLYFVNRKNDVAFVGEKVTEEDIKAKFENGTLKLTIPKKEETPQVEEAKRIAIEG